MKRHTHHVNRKSRKRRHKAGGSGWGFEHMSLDELLKLQKDAAEASTYAPYPAEALVALNEAIELARSRSQSMEVRIGDAETYVDVPPEF